MTCVEGNSSVPTASTKSATCYAAHGRFRRRLHLLPALIGTTSPRSSRSEKASSPTTISRDLVTTTTITSTCPSHADDNNTDGNVHLSTVLAAEKIKSEKHMAGEPRLPPHPEAVSPCHNARLLHPGTRHTARSRLTRAPPGQRCPGSRTLLRAYGSHVQHYTQFYLV